MVGVIASLLLAPQSGILAVDNLSLAIAQGGNWKPMDSIYSKSWPSKSISDSVVLGAAGGECFLLSGKSAKSIANPGLKFGDDDAGPGERGWIVQDTALPTDNIVWFGSKPMTPIYNVMATNSGSYIKAVADFLKTKGHKKPKVNLYNLVQADLNADGRMEVIVFAASRPQTSINSVYIGMSEGPKTEEFSLAMIRYVSGGSVKNAVIYYSGGLSGGIEGHASLAGLWDLDGKPGLEIIHRWSGHEAASASLGKFAGGKYIKVAETGDGV